MNTRESAPGGALARLAGLAAGLLRHSLSVAALASLETKLLVRQSLFLLLLGAACAIAALIAYISLLVAIIALLALKFSWGWPVALAAAGLLHLACLGLLVSMLKRTPLPKPYESTTEELRKDLESLGRLGGRRESSSP